MDPIEKRELKRRAWAKLAAQKRRAGLLRGRVVIASLICFALLWGIVFAQMATGNDPVLSAKSKTVATRADQAGEEGTRNDRDARSRPEARPQAGRRSPPRKRKSKSRAEEAA